MPTLKKFRTEEEKKKLIAKIDDLQKKGKTVHQAAKEIGIPWGAYYAWKRKGKKITKKKTTPFTTIQLDSSNDRRVMILIGDAEDIKSTLNSLVALK